MRYSKEQKLEAIRFYLQNVWKEEAPLSVRVKGMMKDANRYANGHPEWSDIYGTAMKPIDEVSKRHLEPLVAEFLGVENLKAFFEAQAKKEGPAKSHWLLKAEKLEKEAKELRETDRKYQEAKAKIQVGVHIFDLDQNTVAKVIELKKGSNDFSAKFLKAKYSRGYHYVVSNWRLATKEEVSAALI